LFLHRVPPIAQILYIITYQGGEDAKLKASIASLRKGVDEAAQPAEISYVNYPNWWERAKDWELDYIVPWNIWYQARMPLTILLVLLQSADKEPLPEFPCCSFTMHALVATTCPGAPRWPRTLRAGRRLF
jgi:hypothetical protein